MSVSFNKFNQFIEDMAKKVHNLGADALTIALVNSPAPVNTNTVLANLTPIAYTYCSARVPTITSCTQTAGLLKLILADLILTASGGDVGPFRYIVLYNDTPTSPADALIGWYDYGSSITLHDTETLMLDFDGSAGVIQNQ